MPEKRQPTEQKQVRVGGQGEEIVGKEEPPRDFKAIGADIFAAKPPM